MAPLDTQLQRSSRGRLAVGPGERPDQTAGRRRRLDPLRASWLYVLPAVLLTIAVHIAAPAAGGFYAFTDWNGIGSYQFIGLDNFSEILQSPTARQALLNTFKLAFIFVILVNVIGLVLAVALDRAIKTRILLRALFFFPVVISPLATGFIWKYVLNYYGPLNQALGAVGLGGWRLPWLGHPDWALWAVLLVLVWQYTGLAMILYMAGLQAISNDVLEAATMDGAGPIRRFWHVTLPLLAPSVTVATTLTLIYGLRVFDQVLSLTGGGPVNSSETLATQVWRETWVNGRFGYGAALALVLILVVAAITLVQVLLLRGREQDA